MPTITKPEICQEILEALLTEVQEEQQVIVHCCYSASFFSGDLIRIWQSTFLIDENTNHKILTSL